MKVKITKVAENANALCKSGDWSNYSIGEENPNVSLPIDYSVKGTLAFPIEVGNVIFLNRVERNGIPALGITTTSRILSIVDCLNGSFVETQNSFYLVEQID